MTDNSVRMAGPRTKIEF